MSTESLNRTSVEIENPSQKMEAKQRLNVDVQNKRLLEEKKKEKFKRTTMFSFVVVGLGFLPF